MLSFLLELAEPTANGGATPATAAAVTTASATSPHTKPVQTTRTSEAFPSHSAASTSSLSSCPLPPANGSAGVPSPPIGSVSHALSPPTLQPIPPPPSLPVMPTPLGGDDDREMGEVSPLHPSMSQPSAVAAAPPVATSNGAFPAIAPSLFDDADPSSLPPECLSTHEYLACYPAGAITVQRRRPPNGGPVEMELGWLCDTPTSVFSADIVSRFQVNVPLPGPPPPSNATPAELRADAQQWFDTFVRYGLLTPDLPLSMLFRQPPALASQLLLLFDTAEAQRTFTERMAAMSAQGQ